MSDKLFTLPKLAEQAGLEYRTAHLWMKAGIFEPSVRTADGSGCSALFSHEDVKRAVLLTRLRDAGLSLEGVKRVAADPANLTLALADWRRYRKSHA
jgi:DNA-binding transcriptional MerR regulator